MFEEESFTDLFEDFTLWSSNRSSIWMNNSKEIWTLNERWNRKKITKRWWEKMIFRFIFKNQNKMESYQLEYDDKFEHYQLIFCSNWIDSFLRMVDIIFLLGHKVRYTFSTHKNLTQWYDLLAKCYFSYFRCSKVLIFAQFFHL